jgi:23S rRNA C2498 (ribose-2'-O)-methylase RlmM
VSAEEEPEVAFMPGVEGGVFANGVDVFDEIDHLTMDFFRYDPRDRRLAYVVARIAATPSCILVLRHELEDRP